MDQEIIRIEKVSKTFYVKKKSVAALDNINISINKGDIFGIIGMSGAGKSTLVRCINFLEKPTTGDIIVQGKNLSKLSEKELLKLRSRMGMIFQSFNLLMQRTVLQNVTFPLELEGESKSSAKIRAMELLKEVGLEDKANNYPAQLSGGQQQRVAIARALATKPDILLCDEATSALDPQSTAGVLDILQKINKEKGITIVVITHQMNVVESICNRVAVMEHGLVVEQGLVKDVFVNPKSDTAKRIIIGDDAKIFENYKDQNCIKLVFNSQIVKGHLISDMVLKFGQPISILFAKTSDHNALTTGTMILQLPNDCKIGREMINYLKDQNLQVEEL